MSAGAGDPPKSSARTAAFGFIFATTLMNAISFGIMIPILPNLIKQFTHGDTASASEWNVLFATTWGAMQFLVGPVLGMLSDRYGRRPVMLISICGLGIDFLFMAFAPTLAWLYVGRILNGITAGSFSTANAYVADITPPDRRAKSFGILGSAFGFGFMIGPILGGVLGEISLRLPFMVAAGLCLINGLYGAFVLPESLPPERRTRVFNWKRANPLGSLAFLREHRELMGLASVGFLYQLSQTVLPAIFVLYTGYRYGWTPAILGLTFMATGASMICVQMFLVAPVVKRAGERGAVLLGLAIGALGFLVYAIANKPWLYVVGIPIFAMVGLIQPGLLGLMTRRVGPSHQGQLQGANQSLQGISSVIGPSLFGLTFAWSIRHEASLHLPGLPIFISAGLLAIAFLISLRVAHAPAALAVVAEGASA
jgi:DHA1 family tetracycline resistance protein-like MFS transporter